MKKYLLMATMMVVALSANAQSRFEPGTLTIQPKIGFTAAQLTNTPAINLREVGFSKSIDAQPTAGVITGADLEYQLTDRFSLAAGVNWTMAGSGWEDCDVKDATSGTTVKIRDMKIETGYANIPVTANFYLFKGFAVKAGVQCGFLTNAKVKATISASEGGKNIKADIDEDCKNQFKKFDLSIPIGVSYEFNIPIVIDMRYNIGISKVNKESVAGEKDSRNGILTLTVGYKFKL